ncbi:hypothetical protein CEXT_421921 [Caerostris extrusa]|uniref:Uncharacterized protein n=1 Tax=Caerostris extrusa TaxID=172846 RepID=A0AAV4X3D6_CAEEX|nr:hypothetical protein CEXT_421921 [Caerostris extrusa]
MAGRGEKIYRLVWVGRGGFVRTMRCPPVSLGRGSLGVRPRVMFCQKYHASLLRQSMILIRGKSFANDN